MDFILDLDEEFNFQRPTGCTIINQKFVDSMFVPGAVAIQKWNFPLFLPQTWRWNGPLAMWLSKMNRNSQILFLRYSQTKPIVSFVSYCFSFVQSFNCLYLWNQLPNLCGVFTKLKPKQYLNRKWKKKKKKNHIFGLQTHFVWSYHIFIFPEYLGPTFNFCQLWAAKHMDTVISNRIELSINLIHMRLNCWYEMFE